MVEWNYKIMYKESSQTKGENLRLSYYIKIVANSTIYVGIFSTIEPLPK